jgi:hypothetical protein
MIRELHTRKGNEAIMAGFRFSKRKAEVDGGFGQGVAWVEEANFKKSDD